MDSHKSRSVTVRARETPHPSAAAIAAAIEHASGERPRTDGLIDQILTAGKKLDLPEECLVRWIHDKCFDIRARGYPLSAGLLGKAVGEDIIPWLRKNEAFVSQCHRRRDLERNRHAEVQPIQKPAAADPQFASELLADVQRKRKGAHA